ncbi:MAG: zinc ribbon domain-containing protein [Desulfobacterales bacterium]
MYFIFLDYTIPCSSSLHIVILHTISTSESGSSFWEIFCSDIFIDWGTMKCPKCQSGNREGAKFCIECGEIFKKTCPAAIKRYRFQRSFAMNAGTAAITGCFIQYPKMKFKSKVQSSIENADLAYKG